MKYANALNTIPGLGSKTLTKMLEHFECAKDAWNAPLEAFKASGVPKPLAEKIIASRLHVDPEQEWVKLAREGITTISLHDSSYPALLRQIPNPPYLIYAKGNLDCLKYPLLAIVGSRKLTGYGQQVSYAFSKDLAKNGVCIVSGLAFGIDAIAHRGALDAKGKTIAVLGNSLDSASISPRSNFNLAQEIIENDGLLISEFPLVTPANPGTFPARNRIMAGISCGTLVVEAAEKSGSLITAHLALDFNREVFAVPGQIFSPQSEGTNSLIKKSGAKLISCVQDVLEELRIERYQQPQDLRPNSSLSENETNVLSVLSHESVYIDRISKLTKLETSTISSTLAILEIKGLVKNVGGQNYIKL